MSKLMTVPKAEWRPFFDRVSAALQGQRVEIEAASLDIGSQVIARWIPLQGITYDSKDDLVDIGSEQFNHLIRNPRDIAVEEDAAGIVSIAVVDADAAKQIIRLKEPLPLPTPSVSRGSA